MIKYLIEKNFGKKNSTTVIKKIFMFLVMLMKNNLKQLLKCLKINQSLAMG